MQNRNNVPECCVKFRLLCLTLLIIILSGCMPFATSTPPVDQTQSILSTPSSSPGTFPDIPYNLISQESLLQYLTELTSIQPYSGWRNTGSSGEADALDYVAKKLDGFANLKNQGLELERQKFSVYLSTEIWDSRLFMTINGQEIEVPADSLRGARYDRQLAAYFDTDGVQNDSDPNPIMAAGSPILVNDEETLYSLKTTELKGKILFLEYSLIDSYANSEAFSNGSQLANIMEQGLAGLVLVTHYSNKAGESHGAMIGDGSIFQYQIPVKRIPILYIRIEDLQAVGVEKWEDLQRIEAARLTLDMDIFSPGKSGNLIARIPGADSSQSMILGAHIDSPNGPGALDDGSGTAALLEIARILDVTQTQPPVDIYLAWFGGHEIGTYGSAYFASTHQALLDRTLAMVQMDGLGHPLDGNHSLVTINVTPYGRFGSEQLPLPDLLTAAMQPLGISLDRYIEYGLIADNSNFDAFNVPNVYLGYYNAKELEKKGAGYIHYSNHWHDPYETVDLARDVNGAFVEMTMVMLSAALKPGQLKPDLRVAPSPSRRALIVASHTESVTVTTTMFRELSMALAWEGFDVDMIPYAQPITRADLDNVGIVVLPPSMDFPGQHQELWGEAEIDILREYVADGGFLLVTNSAFGYVMKHQLDERNEDARAINRLLEPMGVAFMYGAIGDGDIARAIPGNSLTTNAAYLTMYGNSAVPFRMTSGQGLFEAGGQPVVGLVNFGTAGGQVLIIADLGILQCDDHGAKNLEFIKNIARYAQNR